MESKNSNKQNRNRVTNTEKRLVVAIGEGTRGTGEIGKGGKEVQVSKYKLVTGMEYSYEYCNFFVC